MGFLKSHHKRDSRYKILGKPCFFPPIIPCFPAPSLNNHVNILLGTSYLVAKASVALATKLLKDYREDVFFSPEAVLMLSNVKRKDSVVPWVLV